MSEEMPKICDSCARYRGYGKCEAYPAGIPDAILWGDADHRQPLDGDHGLQYVMADRDNAEFLFRSWQAFFGAGQPS